MTVGPPLFYRDIVICPWSKYPVAQRHNFLAVTKTEPALSKITVGQIQGWGELRSWLLSTETNTWSPSDLHLVRATALRTEGGPAFSKGLAGRAAPVAIETGSLTSLNSLPSSQTPSVGIIRGRISCPFGRSENLEAKGRKSRIHYTSPTQNGGEKTRQDTNRADAELLQAIPMIRVKTFNLQFPRLQRASPKSL